MADRRVVNTVTGETVYAIVTNLADGQVWNTDSDAGEPAPEFETFDEENWEEYAIPLTEQGDTGRYIFVMPEDIPAGTYDIEFRVQDDTDPAIADLHIDGSAADWNGEAFVSNTNLVAIDGGGLQVLDQDFVASSVAAVTGAGEFTGQSALSAADDFYNGMFLVFTSGANQGIARSVSDYTGATRTFSFDGSGGDLDAPFPAAPSGSDNFRLIGRARA